MLALGVGAQSAGTVFVTTPAFLIPLLHTQLGLDLAAAGALAAVPVFGTALTLVLWGALADRRGERGVIVAGLLLTAVAAAGAAFVPGIAALIGFLLLGGMASASASSASGRVVVGWFPKERRGLAMGIRQMSQPLGVTVAALVVPPVAAADGIGATFVPTLVILVALTILCTVGLRNPPRPKLSAEAHAAATANPYRADGFLWRIHTLSALLVVPQFTLTTFGLVWLVAEVGWTTTAAGLLIGVSQFVGALGRIGVGVLSDAVGSRMRPLRWVALSAVVVMLALAVVGGLGPVAVAIVLTVASAVTVADNGLAFTAVAEAAGPKWSGKALGIQNTGQFLASTAVGPGVGALIGLLGYAGAFAGVAALPAVAYLLVPKADRSAD